LGADAVGRGNAAIRLNIKKFSLGPQSIKSGRIAGGLAACQDAGEFAKTVHGGGQLTLAGLSGHQVGEREPQVCLQPAHFIVSAACAG
jgi:hypothetical protein